MMFKALAVAVGCVALVSANKPKKVVTGKSCPNGYAMEGKQCVSRSYEAMQYLCDQGELIGNTCTSFHNFDLSCPAGWTMNGKSCSRSSFTDAVAVCSYGQLEGSSCVSWTEVPLVATCSEGELNGDVCVIEEYKNANYACPADVPSSKGGCYTTETYPCGGKKSSGRWLGKRKYNTYYASGKKGVHYKQPAPVTYCTRKVPVDLVAICPTGWTLSGDGCTRTTTTSADYVCPLDYSSKGCKERTSTPAAYQCPAGFNQTGKGCSATETSSYTASCPAGSHQDGDQCVSHSAPQAYCATGTSNGKNGCVSVSVTEPTLTYGKKY